MMRVRMLTAISGTNFWAKRGQEVEIPDLDALRLLASGQAEHVLPTTSRGQSKDWPLGISPADYLKRHPTGPNAELARQCLAGKVPVEVR